MVRLKDIAEKAKVSTATVSYVINNTGNISKETRDKVLKVLEELNYRPNLVARSLKSKKTRTIGVIVEDISVFNAPEIIDGINSYAEEHGFSILLTNLRIFKRVGNNFNEIDQFKGLISGAMDELLRQQVDGIIYIGVHIRDVTGLVPIHNKPIVYTYCYTSTPKEYTVNFDDERATYDMTNYLIELGHHKVALISGPIDSNPTHQRFAGYHRALMEKQLPFNPIYIKTGDWEIQSGYRMAKELLELEDKPTAIIAMNDVMAGGALEACRDLNVKVPEELSIVGFDDREFGMYLSPKLTTMKLPLSEMGLLSMKKMISILNREIEIEYETRVPCQLVQRESVSAFKG